MKDDFKKILIIASLALAGGVFIGKGLFNKSSYKDDLKIEEEKRETLQKQIDSLQVEYKLLTTQYVQSKEENEKLLREATDKYKEDITTIKEKRNEEITAIRSNDTLYIDILSR